ncbi:solute carrier family 23 protein [uncultured Castellaniella sp.]|uniref:uracil-xanthine permease family protein n=1 Tax=uncultured Castellaniella sp. TaxID=647907 RepID=UPI002604BC32|nr:solute carrier family 23 protein [uncultured Castellaniella sp.]
METTHHPDGEPLADGVHPVDQIRPVHNLILFAIQHILVMVATPISSVFLIASALDLPTDLASALLSSVFVFSGLGSILQSVGVANIGVRLPFIMLPGGAATILFITIAQGTDLQTAAGAVVLTGIFYILVVTVFVRALKYFPPLVIGTMVVVIGINLVKVTGQLFTGRPGTAHFGDPQQLLLAFVTILLTVLCFRFLRGFWRQLSVALGLIGGTIVALALGQTSFGAHAAGPAFALPQFLPFGTPHLDLIAAIPMLIWSIASMAEATGQTIINGEIVGREVVATRDVPRVIRSDGIVSIIGGLFGTPAMVTSGENIGIVRASGVRSRYVTAVAGALLILIGFTPLARILNGIPPAVVGGTAVVVFAIISVLGIQMLARVDFSNTGNLITCTLALALGLLPVLIPGMYHALPANVEAIVGSGVAMSALVAVLLNLLFRHTGNAGQPSGGSSDKPAVGRPANYRI